MSPARLLFLCSVNAAGSAAFARSLGSVPREGTGSVDNGVMARKSVLRVGQAAEKKTGCREAD